MEINGASAFMRPLDALRAAALPLFACATSRRCSGWGDEEECEAKHKQRKAAATLQVQLDTFPEGLYLQMASCLDELTLCRVDASCRALRSVNRSSNGPWRAIGARSFVGIDLAGHGVYNHTEVRGGDDREKAKSKDAARKALRIDWKSRYTRFRQEVLKFKQPYTGSEITGVQIADEVAYCRCSLRSDQLTKGIQSGVYIEVEVLANADNLSLAVVDFMDGGRSSVTFSPDTGAVIREQKVREAPRKVEGAYIQPLATTPSGRLFEGYIGLYVHDGLMAFFRRCVVAGSDPKELGPWETTGFISEMTWAEGTKLTPCLAFRDEGVYRVRIAQVCSRPPHQPPISSAAHDASLWSPLDWEAPPPAAATEDPTPPAAEATLGLPAADAATDANATSAE